MLRSHPNHDHSSSNVLVRRRYGSESDNDKGDSYVIARDGASNTTLTTSSSHEPFPEGSSAFAMAMANSSRDRKAEFINAVRSFQVGSRNCNIL